MTQLADYNFVITDVPGEQYHRASYINLTNPKNGNKEVTYTIEALTNTKDGKYVLTNDGAIYETIKLDSEELRNEEITLYSITGESYGTKTAGEMIDTIMVYLNSHMIHVAKKAKIERQRQEKEMAKELKRQRLEAERMEEERRKQELENANSLITHHQEEIERLQALIKASVGDVDEADATDPEEEVSEPTAEEEPLPEE